VASNACPLGAPTPLSVASRLAHWSHLTRRACKSSPKGFVGGPDYLVPRSTLRLPAGSALWDPCAVCPLAESFWPQAIDNAGCAPDSSLPGGASQANLQRPSSTLRGTELPPQSRRIAANGARFPNSGTWVGTGGVGLRPIER